MKLAVSGSRRQFFSHYRKTRNVIFDILMKYVEQMGVEQIGHGSSPGGGVDAVVDEFCNITGIKCVRFEPKCNDSSCFKARNVELVNWADRVVVFFINNITPGTYHTFSTALSKGKPVDAYLIFDRFLSYPRVYRLEQYS